MRRSIGALLACLFGVAIPMAAAGLGSAEIQAPGVGPCACLSSLDPGRPPAKRFCIDKFWPRISRYQDGPELITEIYSLGVFDGGEDRIELSDSRSLLSLLRQSFSFGDFHFDPVQVEMSDRLGSIGSYTLRIAVSPLRDADCAGGSGEHHGWHHDPCAGGRADLASKIRVFDLRFNGVPALLPPEAYADLFDLGFPDAAAWVEATDAHHVRVHLAGGHAHVNGGVDNGGFKGYLEFTDGRYSGRAFKTE